jgi:hypothetical protein
MSIFLIKDESIKHIKININESQLDLINNILEEKII